MPLSQVAFSLYSTSSSKSPYSFSLARNGPVPLFTSSPLSTLQWLFRSAVQASNFAFRSSGVSLAMSTGLPPLPWMSHPLKLLKSLPLKRAVNPFGGAGSAAVATAAQTVRVTTARKRMAETSERRGGPERAGAG